MRRLTSWEYPFGQNLIGHPSLMQPIHVSRGKKKSLRVSSRKKLISHVLFDRYYYFVFLQQIQNAQTSFLTKRLKLHQKPYLRMNTLMFFCSITFCSSFLAHLKRALQASSTSLFQFSSSGGWMATMKQSAIRSSIESLTPYPWCRRP